MEPALSSIVLKFPLFLPAGQQEKSREFQNWLMIKQLPSFKLRTRHLYYIKVLHRICRRCPDIKSPCPQDPEGCQCENIELFENGKYIGGSNCDNGFCFVSKVNSLYDRFHISIIILKGFFNILQDGLNCCKIFTNFSNFVFKSQFNK